MKDAKPQDLNRKNLIDVSKALKGIEHFVFFGTLLGLVRDGDIIPHDDDIDFYAPIEQRAAVIERLKATDFTIEEGVFPNLTNYFLQAYRVIDGVKTYVDFYLYQTDLIEDFILDRWNFPGTPDDDKTHLHIPKSLIYPLKTARFFDCDIAMPANGDALCVFLYGADWQTPRQKNTEYSVMIDNNTPHCYALTEVPKRIYSLWMQGRDNAPDIVRINFDQWERLNPDYKLIVLDEKTAAPYLKDFPIDASTLTPQTFSDILRVSVLAQTGGVWVDATVYPTMPLSRWLDIAMRKQTFFAYDNPHLYHMPVTSWFLAARERCPMIKKWNDLIRRYWFMPRVAIHQENLTDEKRPDIYLPVDIEAEMGLPDMRPTAGYPYFWLHHLFSHLLRYDSDFADRWEARYRMDYVPTIALQNIYLNRFFYRTKTRENKKRWARHRAAFLLCRPLYLRRLLSRAPMQKLDWRYKKYPLNLLRNRKIEKPKNMKLGVSYNVFDAEELLEPSILAIRDEVAHISVIYQEVSNGNNPCSDGLVALVLDLKKRGLVDKLYKYTPDLTQSSHFNELAKRNLGLKIAKRRFCTHFMSMDTDEFYDPVKFAAAKKTLRYNGATSSAVPIQNYFKSPENLMMYKNYKLFVPFIYKIKWFKKFKFSAGFPVLVDPTRMIKSKDCHVFDREDIIMDHMTLVRKNIRTKLENSSAHQMFRDNGIDEYVKYFENWDPSQPAYRATDFSDIAPIKVVPDKYNIKKFL